MKKRNLLSLSILTAILWSTNLPADGVGVYGSYWDPYEGGEIWGMGVHLRGGEDLVYYEIRATYFEDISDDVGPVTNDFEVIPVDLGLGLQYEISQNLTVYGGGGVSYFFLDSEIGSFDDEFGYYFQVGADAAVNETFSVFAEAIFRRVEGSVENGLSSIDDLDDLEFEDQTQIDLHGTAIVVGLVFNW